MKVELHLEIVPGTLDNGKERQIKRRNIKIPLERLVELWINRYVAPKMSYKLPVKHKLIS